MSTPNINCILQAVVAAQNNLITPTPQIVNYDFGSPTFAANALFFEPYLQSGAAPITPTLPASTIFGLLVQNIGSSGNVQVTYNPTGFGSTNIILGPGSANVPGDALIYFAPSKNSSAGINFVQIQGPAVGSPVPIMLLMVG